MADHRTSSGSSRRSKTSDDVVGNFVIGSEIGKGSFAQVYMGKHKVTGDAVAIKSVELGRLNKKLKENLYSEIKILKGLRHPHIVALHDCLESTTHINLIMEYCELGDLSLFIKKREKLITHPATCDMARKYPSVPNAGLNEVVIRHFMKQLASALQFLREGNFVHRDVKPQNLLLLPSVTYREANRDVRPILSASQDSLIPAVGLRSLPMLKLADFGFARVLPATSLAETLCGSPLYMAPEILRYERYDAKADLWSVGTVLYEMVSGRPPFRASNHVELLRKIENAEDQIKFSRDCQVTAETKSLIRALLKRNPVERMSFENFFAHPAITGDIPGLVEDDVPQVRRQPSTVSRTPPKTDETQASLRRLSIHRRYTGDQDPGRQDPGSSSPREKLSRQSPRMAHATDRYDNQAVHGTSYQSSSPRDDIAPGLGIRRPQPPAPSTSAPSRPALMEDRRRRTSNASLNRYSRDEQPSTSYSPDGVGRARPKANQTSLDEKEKTAQDIAFERDYVVVEKKHVEVNAFADELAAKGAQPQSLRAGHVVRRATQQGVPTSTTGAVPAQPSNALQIAQGRQQVDHYRRGSYEKSLSGSPSSTTSVISKAIQDASVRLFGFKYPSHLLGKGASPPHLYSPFPTTYPTLNTTTALLTDGRLGGLLDEDARVAQCIEDYATRSDVVWGFAEVKYKQLVPLAPSMEHGLGGTPAEQLGSEDEDGLTPEAVVVLSEEALVLYVKALSLLAKSMDIASSWWGRKATRFDMAGSPTHYAAREAAAAQNLINRVNSAVQWIRRRFNETLEKAELVRLRLVDAQKQLPEDHPSHPDNHNLPADSVGANSTTADGIVLSSGLSAEKLMYERALEMSRAAAINEIANEDLAGCEISYVTAIRMLEAVLDHEDSPIGAKPRTPSSPLAERDSSREGASEMNQDDQQAVQKMIQMISGRLSALRKKMQMIANASKAQQSLTHRRSGDVTPRSVPMSVS
ncbi:serine/threonine-protein kinase ATG1 [Microdochium trichocladiopsis]|uniref:non-specific serine/threonine protein kinase n=1 Tax=Microdochium trichocladiopsis TaxID=1682393 RepID=A0A9P9BW61_9PEZI|nr:serine/threonine-protein kinase ATG1 [Microdochium trichocladiopsis]KAH7041038.1 serine/threonine-protein kinase ATG1 [Microdochium trichocladiopsis]